MKHVVMCSFGKDSMAMLYTMKEHKMPIDEIVYVKILFDDEISAELPEHEEWINNYAIPKIKQDFCIDVKVIQANYTYKDLFFKEITRGGRKGNNRGFPLLFGSWCHRDLKIKPVKDFLKQYNKNCKQYIGIAFDEIKRIAWELKQGNKMPLVDFGITEEQAFEICRKYKILSPAYKNFRRLGCWFCHKQGNKALVQVIENYPNLYQKIEQLDEFSDIKFKQKYTAKEIKQKLKEQT